MSKNKKQHYLSVSYLRGFAEDYPNNISLQRTKVKIHWYYKPNNIFGTTSIDGVAHKSYMYSTKKDDGTYDHTYENRFKTIEDPYTEISKQLYNYYCASGKIIPPILATTERKLELIKFIVLQMKRVPKVMDDIKDKFPKELYDSDLEKDNLAKKMINDMGEGEKYNFEEVLISRKT